MFHGWNQAFIITGFLGCLAWCWVQCEGRLTWPCYMFPINRRPGFIIVTPSFSPFIVVGFVKLWLDCLCGNRIFRWILNSAVTFAAAVLWSFLDTLLNVRRSLSLSFGFRPQLLLAGDVFLWSVCVVITLGTAALDTPNEVAIQLQMLQLNDTPNELAIRSQTLQLNDTPNEVAIWS